MEKTVIQNRGHTKEKLTDAELVERVLSGDRSAFDQLVDRYRDQVFRLVWLKVHRTEEAEDLAQEAFVSAYRSLPQLRDPSLFAPWLRRVAENVCNMWLRRNRVALVPLEELHISVDDFNSIVQQRVLRSRVQDALSRLSETNRLAATLFFVDGLSQREIAEFLDTPIGTIKRRINLSRTQLQKEMLDMVRDTGQKEKPKPDFNAGVAVKIDTIRWYRRFSEYIDAGVSIVRSLYWMAREDFSETIRSETTAVQKAIEGGSSLSQALSEHAPSLNHPMAVAMIRAGEVGGVLKLGCQAIVSWLEREDMSLKVDTAYWFRTLSTMLSCGVPIVQAIDLLKTVSPPEPLFSLSDKMHAALYEGKMVSDVLREYSEVFSPAAVSLARAGERTGSLELALSQVAVQILREAYYQMQSDPIIVWRDTGDDLVRELREQLVSPSADTRLGALKALAQSDTAAHADAFITALSDVDASVREEAANVIRESGLSGAVDKLAAVTDDESPGVRAAALEALAAVDIHKAVNAAASALADPALSVRQMAVKVLAQSGFAETAEPLAKALRDESLLVSTPAVDALIALGKDALPVLIQLLEDPSAPRARALEAVVKIDKETARKYALRFLKENDRQTEWRSICVISEVANPDDWQVLVEALDDPKKAPHIAATGLGNMKAKAAVPSLIKALDKGYEEYIVCRVIHSLGVIVDDGVEVKKMVDLLSKSELTDTALRFLSALANRGDDGKKLVKESGAVPVLLDCLSRRKPEGVRLSAARSLITIEGLEGAKKFIVEARESGRLKPKAADETLKTIESWQMS